ncbi:MAG: hypothetical protein JXP73_18210 [Deltaproteobacteria bacterium]|jgi:hypothetical protein|nr:hypothetical protein [Deltaproteobacteria bacterium]
MVFSHRNGMIPRPRVDKAMIERLYRPVLFIVALTIMVLRAPDYFVHPRFWAEEGTYFYTFATTHGWLASLFTPRFGYLQFFSNVSAFLASRLTSVESAPLVTTLLGFLVHLVPVALVVWGNSLLWQSVPRRLAGLGLVLFVPLSGEMWLNTINCKSHFALCALLIFLEEAGRAGTARKWIYRGVLSIACLSSPEACCLTLVFGVKAFFSRERESFVQLGIMMTICALQAVATQFTLDAQVVAGRSGTVTPGFFGFIVLLKAVVLPVLGPTVVDAMARPLYLLWRADGEFFESMGMVTLIAVPSVLVIAMRRCDRVLRITLPLAFYSLLIFSVLFGYGNKLVLLRALNAHRYFWVPGIMVLVGVVAVSKATTSRWQAAVCWVVLSVAILNGMCIYRSSLMRCDSCPRWRAEVQKWRKDAAYTMKIWPEGWSMNLPSRN